jgi:hypothetical protein
MRDLQVGRGGIPIGLPDLAESAVAEGDLPLSYLAEDLPLLVLDRDRALPWLRRVGIEDLPERMVTFPWSHLGRSNVIVVFRGFVQEIADLDALGLPIEQWWRRAVAHERGHLTFRWGAGSRRGHDEDNAGLLTELRDLRSSALGYGVVTGSMSEEDWRRLAVLFAGTLGRQPASRPGGRVVLDWDSWSGLEQRGLGWARTRMVSFTVFDVRGRRWTVMFRHTRVELDRLIRRGFLPADFDQLLEAAETHPARSGSIIAWLEAARIRHEEIARARRMNVRIAAAMGSVRALLALVGSNPGVTSEQLRTAVLPVPGEQARAVMGLLAEFGLVRVGHGGDSFGPVARVNALLGPDVDLSNEARGAVDAVLMTHPGLWDEQLFARVRLLLTQLRGVSELGLTDSGSTNYLDALYVLAATPYDIEIGEVTGVDPVAFEALYKARLVVSEGPDRSLVRVRQPTRHLLGNLANLGDIEDPDYRRGLKSWRRRWRGCVVSTPKLPLALRRCCWTCWWPSVPGRDRLWPNSRMS